MQFQANVASGHHGRQTLANFIKDQLKSDQRFFKRLKRLNLKTLDITNKLFKVTTKNKSYATSITVTLPLNCLSGHRTRV